MSLLTYVHMQMDKKGIEVLCIHVAMVFTLVLCMLLPHTHRHVPCSENSREGVCELKIRDFEVETATLASLNQFGKGW